MKKRMKMLIGAVIFVISFFSVCLAQLYIWTDEKGVKHYTNTLPPDGVKVKETEEVKNYNIPQPVVTTTVSEQPSVVTTTILQQPPVVTTTTIPEEIQKRRRRR